MTCAKCLRKRIGLQYTNWMPMGDVAPYNPNPQNRIQNYPGVENYSYRSYGKSSNKTNSSTKYSTNSSTKYSISNCDKNYLAGVM